jgi:hypothetical protein
VKRGQGGPVQPIAGIWSHRSMAPYGQLTRPTWMRPTRLLFAQKASSRASQASARQAQIGRPARLEATPAKA